MDGSFQTGFNNWWQSHFHGRAFLVRLHNQFLYSVLKTSPNTNVVIGKENQLYEPGYIGVYCAGQELMSDDDLAQVVDKAERLQTLLNEKGKELYFFLTPSKARYVSDDYPWYYDLGPSHDESTYEFNRFLALVKNSDLKYFNCIDYIDTHRSLYQSPVFYSSGIHWSSIWGNACAAAFADYIGKTSGYAMPHASITEQPVSFPDSPSADLYQTLNLFSSAPSNVQYYAPQITVTGQGDQPNVFYRGNSFMGQSLNMLINNSFWGKNVHFENNYYYTDRYSKSNVLSSFTAYNEIDPGELSGYLHDTDIFILSIGEANFTNEDSIDYQFMDYLLSHPDLIG